MTLIAVGAILVDCLMTDYALCIKHYALPDDYALCETSGQKSNRSVADTVQAFVRMVAPEAESKALPSPNR